MEGEQITYEAHPRLKGRGLIEAVAHHVGDEQDLRPIRG